jgi:putative ABC transport system permease protein
MKSKIMKWAVGTGIGVALIAGLSAWAFTPWFIAIGLLVLLALWLLLTKSGRQTSAIAGIGISSLPQRYAASSVIVIGIAGVVAVLVTMLAMAEGLQATLRGTGTDDTAIILRGGSQAETNSSITRDLVPLISTLPGVEKDASGRPEVSAELSQIVNLPTRSNGTDANAQLRGVNEDAWRLRPNLKIIAGRKFDEKLRELVIGQNAQKQFVGLDVGKEVNLGNQRWTIVGEFASNDAHDSEIWGGSEIIFAAYHRQTFQSVTVKLAGANGFNELKAALADDPRLKLDVLTTHDYYAKQSEGLTRLIRILSTVIGSIMAVGAIFGALNTMYATVANRAREIATMRAIGFSSLPVVVAVMLETMLLALLGGILGGIISWVLFNGYSAATLGNNFSQLVFQFKVTPELLWNGLKWALGIGLIGGLFPALRAASMSVIDALRSA